MNITKLGALVVASLIYSFTFAQSHEWSFSFGSTQFDRAYGVEVDGAGNVYVCGAFDGTVDFDPDSLGTSLITEEGNGDVYLAKYSNSGEHIWSHNIGSWGHDLGSDMVVDDQGNIYLTGYFRVDVDFDLGPDTAIISAIGTRDVFVAKYTTHGDYEWAFNIALGGNVERYPGIGLDPQGNVLVTGDFGGTQDFDPGPGVTNITSNGNQDIFIAKYDNSGNFIWANALGGSQFDGGRDIVADSQGDVYVTGTFLDSADMDGGPGVATVVSNGSWDSFIAKYSASGNYMWAHGFGGSGTSSSTASESGMDLAVDDNDNVVIVGFYTGSPDVDPGSGVALLDPGADKNAYVIKYNGAGNHIWSFGLPDAGEGQANSVAVDPTGQVYVTGCFEGSVDFDPGAGSAVLVGWDVFTAKYDENGDYVWAFRAGDSAYDGGWGIAVDDTANVYVTGVFYGLIDLDPDTTVAAHDHVGGRDVFVAKYNPCYRSILNVDMCAGDSYLLPDGSIATSGGVYPVSYALVGGCDSVITVVLDEIVLDTGLTNNSGVLTVGEVGATYQWVDCGNGNTPITGANGQSFAPAASGTYAVIVQAAGCTATSACTFFSSTGLEDRNPGSIVFYPNPTSDIINLLYDSRITRVRLYDSKGSKQDVDYINGQLDMQVLSPGLYLLEIEVESGEIYTEVVFRR